jgi:DEAD/DEAH box helicase domain-containing protein
LTGYKRPPPVDSSGMGHGLCPPHSVPHMDITPFLSQLRRQPFYQGQIVHLEQIGRRSAKYSALGSPLHPDLHASLRSQGIERLFSHQAEAVNAARAGRHLAVVTSTASGKTLCYNLPVLEAILAQPTARALYLFPTKALAQDQLRSLRELGCRSLDSAPPGFALPVTVAAYDGDTPQARRAKLRQQGQIILTNPDMLHVGILPNHALWASFFRHLRYVVIDEAHTYRGVFGSQVACVLRRLRRVCALYGSQPQFIAASATIANPGQHIAALTGLDPLVIDDDGSPAGPRSFALWNPPLLASGRGSVGDRPQQGGSVGNRPQQGGRGSVGDRPQQGGSVGDRPQQGGLRRSANGEATQLFTALVRHDTRTIVFTRARKVAELILRYAREELSKQPDGRGAGGRRGSGRSKGSQGPHSDDPGYGLRVTDYASRIASYRAGYTPEQRRQIEADLFSGRLIGVTATSALELGIDVGGLDAAVLVGYPGTVASLWQQAGRAGRGSDPSLAVLIGLDNPLDQYFMRHPADLFGRPHEHALIDPDNVYVLARHLPCAAAEVPLSNLAGLGRFDDEALFGPGFVPAMVQLEEQGVLDFHGDRWTYTRSDYPAEKVNLRSAGGGRFALLDEARNHRVLEEIEASSAPQRVHPGAIYLHQGESYRVTRFDAEMGFAVLQPAEVDYYTTSREWSDVRIVRSLAHRPIPGGFAYFGMVRVASQVVGYRRLRHYSEEVLGEEMLELPQTTFETAALWWDLAPQIVTACQRRGLDFLGGIHAAEHACIGILPLFAMCDRWDIGGLSTPRHADTDAPQIFIYDGFPGGVGIAERGFQDLPALWRAAHEVIAACPCEAGCPSCIHSPKCGNNNQPLDKAAAKLILGMLQGNGTQHQRRID